MFPTLIFDGERIEPGTLAERAERAASGFAALGVAEGDVIAVMLRNEPAYLEAMCAARALGAYLCPINWHFRADEAGYILRDSGAKALVIDATLVEQVREGIPASLAVIVATPAEATRRAFALPDVEPAGAGAVHAPGTRAAGGAGGAIASAWPRYAPWRDAHPRYAGEPKRPRGMVPYTSGTTGRPKGVRRHPPQPERAAWQAEQAARLFRIVFALDAGSRALLAALRAAGSASPRRRRRTWSRSPANTSWASATTCRSSARISTPATAPAFATTSTSRTWRPPT